MATEPPPSTRQLPGRRAWPFGLVLWTGMTLVGIAGFLALYFIAGPRTAPRELARGLPQVAASDPVNAPFDLAVDDAFVYWTSPRDHNVRALGKQPGRGGPRLLAEAETAPRHLAVDATGVYFTTDGGAVLRADRRAGAPATGAPVTTLAASLHRPAALALDATDVFVAVAAEGRILALPKAGGPARVVATGLGRLQSLALDERFVYFAAVAEPPAQTGPAAEAPPAGHIARVAKAGGAPLTLATDLAAPGALVVDEAWLYVAEAAAGRLRRARKEPAPGAPAQLLARTVGRPNALALAPPSPRGDGEAYLYFTTAGPAGTVARVRRDGGPVEVLASAQAAPTALVLDRDRLWWAAEAGHAVLWLPR
jgi:sugar lactone lactonase YvrE